MFTFSSRTGWMYAPLGHLSSISQNADIGLSWPDARMMFSARTRFPSTDPEKLGRDLTRVREYDLKANLEKHCWEQNATAGTQPGLFSSHSWIENHA